MTTSEEGVVLLRALLCCGEVTALTSRRLPPVGLWVGHLAYGLHEGGLLALIARAAQVYAWYVIAVILAGSALVVLGWLVALARGSWRRL
jgi:hypothetical protein